MADRSSLENRLHEEALAVGADHFGVADLSAAHELVRELGGQIVDQFPRAISIETQVT